MRGGRRRESAGDLIIGAIVFWLFLYQESQRHEMGNWWIYILATLTIGPSCALPLFLYFRESTTERMVS